MRRKEVKLFLPRFKIGATLALADTLAAMGMKKAFTPAADFRGLSEESLSISAVIHQALVEVDEVGTEAAAATAIVAVTAAAPQPDPPKPVVFRADHPFVFAIGNQDTGEVLFLGRVDNPKG
jgi:serpin B